MQSSPVTHNLEWYVDHCQRNGIQFIRDSTELPAKLDPNALAFCREKGDVLLLEDATIVTCTIYSTSLNDVKQQFGLVAPTEMMATKAVIEKVLASAHEPLAATDKTTEGKRRLDKLIKEAVQKGASDIHLVAEPTQKVCHVWFRIHGVLTFHDDWTEEDVKKVHSVAHNAVSQDKSDTFTTTKPQDMSFTLVYDDIGTVRIRSVSVGTKHDGYKIVYRLLSIDPPDNKQEAIATFHALGYTEIQCRALIRAQRYNQGMVIFCGETGSGKTTSLASSLSGIDARRATYSVEDPVERLLGNVIQCNVNEKRPETTFAAYLRAFLRADPDVIMVGEIRDTKTAAIAIQAAMTGHLIYTTLHAAHAINAVSRLVNLGVSARDLASQGILRLLVAQKLYPVVCPMCKRGLTDDEATVFNETYTPAEIEGLRTCGNDKACGTCSGNGVTGRTVIAEMITIDTQSRHFIAREDYNGWQTYLQQQGFVGLEARVRAALIEGKIDALDVKSYDVAECDAVQYGQERA